MKRPHKVSRDNSSREKESNNASVPPIPKNQNAKNLTLYITHLNITLHALCHWIQLGVLPVSKFNKYFL